jgi:hypothetical protein
MTTSKSERSSRLKKLPRKAMLGTVAGYTYTVSCCNCFSEKCFAYFPCALCCTCIFDTRETSNGRNQRHSPAYNATNCKILTCQTQCVTVLDGMYLGFAAATTVINHVKDVRRVTRPHNFWLPELPTCTLHLMAYRSLLLHLCCIAATVAVFVCVLAAAGFMMHATILMKTELSADSVPQSDISLWCLPSAGCADCPLPCSFLTPVCAAVRSLAHNSAVEKRDCSSDLSTL